MKKTIVICIFVLLFLVTIVTVAHAAVASYRYDMDPQNGVDLLEGFTAVFILIFGGFVILYELDLFYTTYYFVVMKKTLARSILNVLSNASFAFVFGYYYLSNVFMELRAMEETPVVLFFVYIILRMVYYVISHHYLNQEESGF